MSEYKKVKAFTYGGASILRVAAISYDPVVGQLGSIPDASGDVTFNNVSSTAVRGVVTILDKAEAVKMAVKPDSSKTITFKVETELDVDKTVTLAGVSTGPMNGTSFSLPGSGPWQIEFGASSASEPV